MLAFQVNKRTRTPPSAPQGTNPSLDELDNMQMSTVKRRRLAIEQRTTLGDVPFNAGSRSNNPAARKG